MFIVNFVNLNIFWLCTMRYGANFFCVCVSLTYSLCQNVRSTYDTSTLIYEVPYKEFWYRNIPTTQVANISMVCQHQVPGESDYGVATCIILSLSFFFSKLFSVQ